MEQQTTATNSGVYKFSKSLKCKLTYEQIKAIKIDHNEDGDLFLDTVDPELCWIMPGGYDLLKDVFKEEMQMPVTSSYFQDWYKESVHNFFIEHLHLVVKENV